MKHKIHMFTTAVLLLLTASFIIQNTAVIQLRFLFWTFSSSRVVMVLILLLIGFILGVITSSLLRHKHPH